MWGAAGRAGSRPAAASLQGSTAVIPTMWRAAAASQAKAASAAARMAVVMLLRQGESVVGNIGDSNPAVGPALWQLVGIGIVRVRTGRGTCGALAGRLVIVVVVVEVGLLQAAAARVGMAARQGTRAASNHDSRLPGR